MAGTATIRAGMSDEEIRRATDRADEVVVEGGPEFQRRVGLLFGVPADELGPEPLPDNAEPTLLPASDGIMQQTTSEAFDRFSAMSDDSFPAARSEPDNPAVPHLPDDWDPLGDAEPENTGDPLPMEEPYAPGMGPPPHYAGSGAPYDTEAPDKGMLRPVLPPEAFPTRYIEIGRPVDGVIQTGGGSRAPAGGTAPYPQPVGVVLCGPVVADDEPDPPPRSGRWTNVVLVLALVIGAAGVGYGYLQAQRNSLPQGLADNPHPKPPTSVEPTKPVPPPPPETQPAAPQTPPSSAAVDLAKALAWPVVVVAVALIVLFAVIRALGTGHSVEVKWRVSKIGEGSMVLKKTVTRMPKRATA